MKHSYVKLLLSLVTAALLLAIPLIALRIERSYMRKLGDAGLESKKHSDGGYVADKAVLAFFEEKEYRYTGGRYDNQAIKYRLHRPSNIDPQKTYPLIVWLHGKGESGDENTRQLSHVQASIEFFDGENELDFFMLATQCPKDNPDWNTSISPEGKGDAPLTILGEILDYVLIENPIDRNKIGLVGLCSGGRGVWPLMQARSDFFSGVVLLSTSTPMDFQWDERYRNTAIWAFTNLDDDAVSTPEMRNFINRVNDSGGIASLTVRETGGHDTWTSALKEDKAVAWLAHRDRTRSSPPPGVVMYVRNDWRKPFVYFVLPLSLIGAVGFVRLRQLIGFHRVKTCNDNTGAGKMK